FPDCMGLFRHILNVIIGIADASDGSEANYFLEQPSGGETVQLSKPLATESKQLRPAWPKMTCFDRKCPPLHQADYPMIAAGGLICLIYPHRR
ncbi:MAG: hypothetical protein ACK5II_11905, partial [Paracoccus sp. (in: a-proteobacteria)]